ncbi:hypothetical protein [Sorangium sp. So ce1024]|uniref:hypothetical protein n=1 Tax=Sorangium sp. So ce1024 TaxID=3133327 RepID=UPI003F0DD271
MSGERYDRPGQNGAGYWDSHNRFVSAGKVVIAGAVTRTTTGNGPAVEIGDMGTLRLRLNVTATEGTPTLDITLQTSKDGSTWRTLGTFAQATGEGSELKSFPGCDRYVREAATVGGSDPSITYTIDGEAV